MFSYNNRAVTFKNINRFSYAVYSNISVNFLKNMNDSSAAFRLVDAMVKEWRSSLEDVPYISNFSLTRVDFIQIDRMNKFALSKLGFDINTEILKGFSKYTNSFYDLMYCKKDTDFIRHSYPCDMFVSDKVLVDKGPIILKVPASAPVSINKHIHSSCVTIVPGAIDETLIDIRDTIYVRLFGVDIQNNYVEEIIRFSYFGEFVSKYEYIYLDKILLINSINSMDITIYPFINGKVIEWDESIVTREEFDVYDAVVSFDKTNRNLIFSTLLNLSIDIPTPTEEYKLIEISGIGEGETIIDWFIDKDNGLFYILTDIKLYCYPFIIPQKDCGAFLDTEKTEEQAVRIDYFDNHTDGYDFYIFPTSKTNDVDLMDIILYDENYENPDTFQQDIILDLIRENLSTNKITIPYTDLWRNNDTHCYLTFNVYGDKDATFVIHISRPIIYPLYSKELSTIPQFADSNDTDIYLPDDSSTLVEYQDYLSNNSETITIDNSSRIFRLSKYGNLLINGYIVEHIFNTFYYNENENVVITHDSITKIGTKDI